MVAELFHRTITLCLATEKETNTSISVWGKNTTKRKEPTEQIRANSAIYSSRLLGFNVEQIPY